MEPKTYCEKWPVGCQFCDLLLCDGKKETALYKVTTMNKAGVPGEVLNFEYTHKCEPCKPTQPECGECEFAKPQTNYDRLISKTPEELAEKMVDYSYCPPGTACKPTCKECWLLWLKAPVEVDNG